MEEIKTVQVPAQDDNVIVVDDGRIDIPIRNQFGETMGIFRFNPTDLNIVNRYNEAADRFEKIVKPLENYDIDQNGEGSDDDAIKALNEAEDQLIELLDYVLGGNSREAFFREIHAFTPTNGKFFCETMYDAVGKFISKKFDAETKKVNVRLQQHTHGYKTGKHAKGWK